MVMPGKVVGEDSESGVVRIGSVKRRREGDRRQWLRSPKFCPILLLACVARCVWAPRGWYADVAHARGRLSRNKSCIPAVKSI